MDGTREYATIDKTGKVYLGTYNSTAVVYIKNITTFG